MGLGLGQCSQTWAWRGVSLMAARCDRETRQALWGDDLGEGPLQPLQLCGPGRASPLGCHGADLQHLGAGQGPPVLRDGELLTRSN